MDHGERLAKVEVAVDEHKERMERIECDIGRIYASIDSLRVHTDKGFAELRDHTDKGLADLRKHTDHGLAELRTHTDQGLAEIRLELQRSIRWLIGVTFANGIAIVGLAGKISGLY